MTPSAHDLPEDRQWWWNLTRGRAEQGGGDANMERMGPYATRDEAEGALGRARARTEAWDAEDRAWDEDVED
ncbi:MAG TPA: hypothetical protein VK908_06510 [Jiangellales bacterium]|nr:hypothetical protein [Jiangellales bacterium]